MDKTELKRYRLSYIRERDALIEKINQRYERKLAALDVLLEDDPGEPEVQSNGATSAAHTARTLKDAVKEAIAASTVDFSSASLYKHYIRVNYPNLAEKPTDLSNALWRFKRDGLIEVVRKGSGTVASTYKKTPAFAVALSAAA